MHVLTTETGSFENVSTFADAKPRFDFPAEIIAPNPPGESIPPSISNGSPRMFAVCLGNGKELKHFHVGATLPEWSNFPEFKEFCKQARKSRFGSYNPKIDAAAGMLRGFLEEEEDIQRRKLAYVCYYSR